MTGTVIGTIGVIAAAIVTGFFTYLGVRRSAKAQLSQAATERELGLIDRYRAEIARSDEKHEAQMRELSARLDDQEAIVEEMRRRLKCLERREHRLHNYALALRAHIEQGLGPPAPPWPTFQPTDEDH